MENAMMRYKLSSLVISTTLLLGSLPAVAADINNGKKIDMQKCYQCHSQKSGLGNGDMIYLRADRKVKNLERLKVMVNMCNTTLSLDMFPEEEADVVAYLNQQFYKFK
jgi:cytochrome c2